MLCIGYKYQEAVMIHKAHYFDVVYPVSNYLSSCLARVLTALSNIKLLMR